MSEELRECPFCNGTNLDKVQYLDLVGWMYWVECIICGHVRAISLVDMEDAIRKWNIRPAEDALKKELTEQAINYENTLCEYRNTIKESVEQIDTLTAENERLKNALQKIVDLRMLNPNLKESAYPSSCSEDMFVNFYCKMGDIAVKTLTNNTNVPIKNERKEK